jgi:hypothetical protein
MDCKTAQLFLEFTRPHADELAADDLRALDDHLASCPDCGALAQNERRIDEHLGRAMRAVEVPDRLREHLLARLEAERGDWYKRWAGHGLRAAIAAAACLLLVVGGVYGYSQYLHWNRPALDPEKVYQTTIDQERSPPGRAEVEKSFQAIGVKTVLPDLNYRYLTAHGMGEFQGVVVPLLVFNQDDNERRNNAEVYVVSDQQFKLEELTANWQSPGGYKRSVMILHQPGAAFAYVIVYSGDSFDWLNPPQ